LLSTFDRCGDPVIDFVDELLPDDLGLMVGWWSLRNKRSDKRK
jgi:hypothetical protein